MPAYHKMPGRKANKQHPALSFRTNSHWPGARDEARTATYRASRGDANVLILGESGTGKEVVSEVFMTCQSGILFVPVNCVIPAPVRK